MFFCFNKSGRPSSLRGVTNIEVVHFGNMWLVNALPVALEYLLKQVDVKGHNFAYCFFMLCIFGRDELLYSSCAFITFEFCCGFSLFDYFYLWVHLRLVNY